MKRLISTILLFALLAGYAGDVPKLSAIPTVPDLFTQPSGTTEPTQPAHTDGTENTQPESAESSTTTENDNNPTEETTVRSEAGHMSYGVKSALKDEAGKYLVYEGDTLEIWCGNINYPYYSLSEGLRGFAYTSGSAASGYRLLMEDAPQNTVTPDIPDRVQEIRIDYVDLQAGEIVGWTDTDWQENYEFRMYVNGKSDTAGDLRVYGITEYEPVKLRFEVWGNPHVHYGLVFFVDTEPVSIAEEDMVFLGVTNGQKTVVEIQLDMVGFDGESVVYAALVPRNWRSAEVLTMNWLDMTRTFFLVAGERE